MKDLRKLHIPHINITITATCVDDAGCLYYEPIVDNMEMVSSVDEFKRFKKDPWEILALLLIDSRMPSPKQIDEITGHPGYRFGKKIRGKKNA